MSYFMAGTISRSRDAKRCDALLALPLAAFRRALTHLSVEELAALQRCLTVQMIRGRWQRGGGHGVERHRSANALGLLARRQTALRHEQESRQAAAPAPIDLRDYVADARRGALTETDEHAA